MRGVQRAKLQARRSLHDHTPRRPRGRRVMAAHESWHVNDPLDKRCPHAEPQADSQLHGVCVFCCVIELEPSAPT